MDATRPPPSRWWYLRVIGLGLVSIAVMAVWAGKNLIFLQAASRAEGTVVDSQPHPTVEFVTANGTRVRFTQNGGLTASIGTHVTVGYGSNDPSGTAAVVDFWTMWGFYLGMLPLAALLALPLLAIMWPR